MDGIAVDQGAVTRGNVAMAQAQAGEAAMRPGLAGGGVEERFPKDCRLTIDDRTGWGGAPYYIRLLQLHPDAREAAARGVSHWRCC